LQLVKSKIINIPSYKGWLRTVLCQCEELKNSGCFVGVAAEAAVERQGSTSLAAETVERLALALELEGTKKDRRVRKSEDMKSNRLCRSRTEATYRIDDVHGRHGLATGVLGVGDGVANDVLQEDLEDTAGLLVDETGDTLDTPTTSQAADGGLGDALDVVAKDLAVALGSALAQSLASFSSARHVD
jgi:hypothetical protein